MKHTNNMLKYKKDILLMFLASLFLCNIACKQRGENFMLASLEVDGRSIPISYNMDAGMTPKGEVFVLVKTFPVNRSMILGPLGYSRTGKRNDMWELKIGENILEILLPKDKREEKYTVRLVRLHAETPYLTKLTINEKTIEKDSLKQEDVINIEVPSSTQSVKLLAEANVQDAIISYEPELIDGLLILNANNNITEANIIVEKFGFFHEYRLMIKKTTGLRKRD